MSPLRWLRALRDLLIVDTHPACPICGKVLYIKAMPLHLSGHDPDDPDVIAWRKRGVAQAAA